MSAKYTPKATPSTSRTTSAKSSQQQRPNNNDRSQSTSATSKAPSSSARSRNNATGSNKSVSKNLNNELTSSSSSSAGGGGSGANKASKSSVSQTAKRRSHVVVSSKKKSISSPAESEKNDPNFKEMATTSERGSRNLTQEMSSEAVEQETDVDCESEEKSSLLVDLSSSSASTLTSSSVTISNDEKGNQQKQVADSKQTLPSGWEQHKDKLGPYFWHISTGVIQRNRPTSELSPSKDSVLVCHDDEEIDAYYTEDPDDDDTEYYESGAALTINDETSLAGGAPNEYKSAPESFVVYPLGCCEFDETQLVSTTNTKAIQKCILRLLNQPSSEETVCWGLTQSQPVLLRLFDEYMQFTDIATKTLLRNQPIQTIKTWAVDDDNNFAFVIEDRPADQINSAETSVDHALISEPSLICYVFRSMDDDDMSCKVASKLTREINRYKEQLSNRISKSARVQQMVVKHKPTTLRTVLNLNQDPDQTDIEGEDLGSDKDDDLEATNEMTMNVKYVGQTSVPRPTGIDVLNVAIDKCLAEASKAQINRSMVEVSSDNIAFIDELHQSPLIEAKLHVSPSSVIVENVMNGEIIVECRIRYLTFMGISKRDIRWCGFIMQNATNKTFVAHCFECHPTAGHVCEAIRSSCSKMYEKVLKNTPSRNQQPEILNIVPSSSKIRDTLAKTLSRIRLNPLVSNLN